MASPKALPSARCSRLLYPGKPSTLFVGVHPALNPQARHTVKLAAVIGYQDQPLRTSMPGNHVVVRPNRLPGFGQLSPKLACMRSSIFVVLQYVQARGKTLNNPKVALGARRLRTITRPCLALLLQQNSNAIEHLLHDGSRGFLFETGFACSPIKRTNLMAVNISLGVGTRPHQRDQKTLVTGILSAPLRHRTDQSKPK